MDANTDDPPPTAENNPSPSPSSNLNVLVCFPSHKPGMGLPFELWDHIIGFLKSEPYPFLACCLTCHTFHEHAELKLQELMTPRLSLDNYTDINHIVDKTRTVPGRAQVTTVLKLTGQFDILISTVPHRLASQLINLKHMSLNDISDVPNVS